MAHRTCVAYWGWLLLPLAACSDASVKVVNALPEALITSHEDGAEVYEGYAEGFRGFVSDPDDETTDTRPDRIAAVLLFLPRLLRRCFSSRSSGCSALACRRRYVLGPR